MPKYKVNDTEIYYEVKGDGDPIVFTHGASWNHQQWQPQVKFFSNDHKTIVWDVRGHGYSTLPGGKVNAEDFSKDLIMLLDHLNIKKAALCGLSMGGHISLQTAIRYPDRVSALILIGTPFTNNFNWYEKVFVPINRVFNRFVPIKLFGKMQSRKYSRFNNNKQYVEQAVNLMKYKNWVRIWDTVTRMESRDHLKNVKCPTLILQGDKDKLIDRQQKYLHHHIRNSEFKIVRNASHATNLDNPAEVNAYINHFLQQKN